MRYLYFILIALLSLPVHAQNSFYIKGKVLDDSTGLPLEGASVLCQNTTRGTFSDRDGAFGLMLPTGGHNIVVSFAGFENAAIRVSSSADNQENMEIKLRKKTKNLEDVVIQATNEVADGWQKYGKEFTAYFIGSSPNAAACTLSNPEVLKFYFSKKRNRLKVKADDALMIVNNALGYKIQYQLDSFMYDYNSNGSTYNGAAFYIEMDSTEVQKNIWKINREKAYNGSRLHFMRSYYDSTLTENNFVIKAVQTDSISGKIKTETLDNPYDSSFYDVINDTEKDILLVGKYLIEYSGAPMERSYLVANKFPLTAKEQLSTVDMMEGFVVAENGFFYEQQSVINSGYWAWKNLADQLPYDYWPEEK